MFTWTIEAASQPGPNPGPAYVNVGSVTRGVHAGNVYVSVETYRDGYDRFCDAPVSEIDENCSDACAWLTQEQAIDLIRAIASRISTTGLGGN